MGDDLGSLRERYLDWQFGTFWVTANSGPDARCVWARRDGMLLTAWSAAQLASDIRDSGKGSSDD